LLEPQAKKSNLATTSSITYNHSIVVKLGRWTRPRTHFILSKFQLPKKRLAYRIGDSTFRIGESPFPIDIYI